MIEVDDVLLQSAQSKQQVAAENDEQLQKGVVQKKGSPMMWLGIAVAAVAVGAWLWLRNSKDEGIST